MINKEHFPSKLVFHIDRKGNRLKLHNFLEVICFLDATSHVLKSSDNVIILRDALVIVAAQIIIRVNKVIWIIYSKKEVTLAWVDFRTVKILVKVGDSKLYVDAILLIPSILHNLEGKRGLHAK
jgi:hypothetical protein